jgi:hypothetical protein
VNHTGTEKHFRNQIEIIMDRITAMKRKRASLESISGKKFMILLYSRSLGK